MKKLSLITTIYIVLSLLFVIGNFTAVMANPGRIEDPGFEDPTDGSGHSTYWTYFETDPEYITGTRSPLWKSQGSYSYLLSSIDSINYLAYTQVAQSGLNFDLIDTITFDAYLYSASTYFKASVLVGGIEVWTKDCPNTPTAYLREIVDVSTEIGTKDLIFRITNHKSPSTNKDSTNYFDNIKIWGSYSDTTWLTVENSFANSTNHAYMYGENFDSGTTKVGWYDGSAADGGAWRQTDENIGWGGGILDWSECNFMVYNGIATAGAWHAVVIKTVDDLPANYDAAVLHANFVADDVFNVAATAIPEFPEVMAAIGVAGFCFGIYYWMRKRVRRVHGIS